MALALVAGLLLAVYDLRTDDSGVELGLLLFSSMVLAYLGPRMWWIVALLVGGFIPIVELGPVGSPAHLPAGIVALGVTFVGAFIGFAITRASRSSSPA